MGSADGAYSRETGTIYLSADCPQDLITAVLLEEIGHHIDALFNQQETPGDEGSLFSAAVRGITLSEEEITAILNEDDSAILSLYGREIAVECAAKPAPPSRAPLHPVVTVKPGTKSGTVTGPGTQDSISSAVSYDLSTSSPAAHGLTLTGSGNLTGYGNSQIYNYLDARQNSGNTTLFAGPSNPSAKGPSSSTLWGGAGDDVLVGWTGARAAIPAGTKLPSGFAANTDQFVGGAGSSTMFAGNVASTLIGGQKNNLLFADVLSGANQSLYGGTGPGSSTKNGTTTYYGNTLNGGTGKDTLRSGTGYNTLVSGSATALQSNTLIGGGISNSLVAGTGNDSLTAVSGASTLVGGRGKDTLLSGSGTNSLVSGSAVGLAGNGNLLNASLGTSNTLVAGLGRDTLIGGTKQNLLLLTQANMAAFATDSISLSTLSSAQNTLGLSSAAPITINDSLFATMATAKVSNLGTVADLPIQGGASNKIILGTNAEKVGVHTLVAGLGSDTLSVAGYATNSALLDASKSVSRTSLVGGGSGNDTFLGSKGGYDTMIGAAGNDSFVVQASALAGSSFGLINGNGGTDTLLLSAAASLAGTNFNGVSNIEVLQLGAGNNSVGSLQGSGIQKIVGNSGSDTLSANVYGIVRSVTQAKSAAITLNVSPGTSSTMGFAVGQVITGNGIAIGTTITNVSSTAAVGATPGTVTITLSNKTISLISQGGAVTGWLNGATLDGSAGLGFPPTDAETLRASTAFRNPATSITAANYGTPFELQKDTLAISTLKNDPSTYIHRKGDYLVSYGQNDLLIGGQGNGLPDLNIGGNYFVDKSSDGISPVANNIPSSSFKQHQVVDNTLISGAFASNTLIGGSGANLYLINNQPGATSALPTIQNPTSLQSASTIQFTGNGVKLNDTALSSVSARAAQRILTANGNNLIAIGQNAAQIGIQTIIGGVGSDTFTAPIDYTPSVYFDASRGSGNQSLAAGYGNDTLLAGSGNATLVGGDGNNSLRGGLGNNLILSGVGNSTLDGGYGTSTLQADGGVNRFIVRNRNTRILSPYTLEEDPLTGVIAPPNPAPIATTPEIGIVDTYVNFDPIQGDPVSQFAPDTPDNSPSITKSPSFASSDLSSFYNLQYFNLLGSANYGVGNALDNSISAATANALILGMGGNNTLVASGAGSSLYGNSNDSYASPDLYAYAPIDTRTQAFVDGVMGVAGNNSLVANGASSFLDGGTGYDDGLFVGSGSNILIGTGGNDTFVQRHQADMIQAGGTGNTLYTSVDLYNTPQNITQLYLVVGPELANSGQVTQSGQRVTPGYLAIGDGNGGSFTSGISTGGYSLTSGFNDQMQVVYAASDGTVYGSDNVTDANLSLNVGTFVPDPKNPGTKQAVTLSWTTPLDPNGYPVGQTVGYLVNYQLVATDGNGNILSQTPYLTYLKGTSQDFNDSTSLNPRLTIDNLPTSFTDPYSGITYDSSSSNISYNFKVTAQETVLPAVTDIDPSSPTYGQLIAKPVTLIGGAGNDYLFGGLLGSTNPTKPAPSQSVLNNNPVDPLDPGTIATPAPWQITGHPVSNLYPTYMDGGLSGNDLLVSQAVNDRSGNSFTAYEYINGVPMAVTFASGLNTMVGGQGSDTFVVNNGGTGLTINQGSVQSTAYDQVIKYGSETPGTPDLIVSQTKYLSLSDTTVSQGKFIQNVTAALGGQFIEGNRLNNTLIGYTSEYGYDDGTDTVAPNTLMGALGQDFLSLAGGAGILIGGTAYGLDSISGARADYANGQTSSIYRDTDPIPVSPNGPGTADNSQYTTLPGHFGPVYNFIANSDTLVGSGTLDGGAGNDSMVAGAPTTFYVSSYNVTSATDASKNLFAAGGNTDITQGDVIVSNETTGSANTVVYTGSDLYWSGYQGATGIPTGCSIADSISNLTLQQGDPIALYAVGNNAAIGNQHTGIPGAYYLGTEAGSNKIVGNEFDNTLNGGGVGGANGSGVGVDTLTGHVASLGYTDANTFVIGANYRGSTANQGAEFSDVGGGMPVYMTGDKKGQLQWATDGDYAVITDFGTNDKLQLAGSLSDYVIGAAPGSNVTPGAFSQYDISGFKFNPVTGQIDLNAPANGSTDFGIYYVNGISTPNLVAEVKTTRGLTLGALAGNHSVGGLSVDGTFAGLGGTSSFIDNTVNKNYLGLGAMYDLQGSTFASHVSFG